MIRLNPQFGRLVAEVLSVWFLVYVLSSSARPAHDFRAKLNRLEVARLTALFESGTEFPDRMLEIALSLEEDPWFERVKVRAADADSLDAPPVVAYRSFFELLSSLEVLQEASADSRKVLLEECKLSIDNLRAVGSSTPDVLLGLVLVSGGIYFAATFLMEPNPWKRWKPLIHAKPVPPQGVTGQAEATTQPVTTTADATHTVVE